MYGPIFGMEYVSREDLEPGDIYCEYIGARLRCELGTNTFISPADAPWVYRLAITDWETEVR